ncbi:MAG: hypothetical protein IKR94_01690 [Bacteroidales bacterium]|nr:hypothetical protein [Salinivirgaceae bacterium]MBR4214015.1 hypothetical protein [Bacteroidales bacterium]
MIQQYIKAQTAIDFIECFIRNSGATTHTDLLNKIDRLNQCNLNFNIDVETPVSSTSKGRFGIIETFDVTGWITIDNVRHMVSFNDVMTRDPR